MIFLLKGLLAGIIISAPTGPIGFLCIKRTLNEGLHSGIATGLGAVVADLIYGSILLLGFMRMGNFFVNNHGYLETVGAIVLIVLGYFTYVSKREKKYNNIVKLNPHTLIGKWFLSFFITMTSPIQLISFGFVLSLMGMIGKPKDVSIIFLTGLVIGASFWWICIAKFIHHIRNNFKPSHILKLNRITGLVIFVSGLLILIRSFF